MKSSGEFPSDVQVMYVGWGDDLTSIGSTYGVDCTPYLTEENAGSVLAARSVEVHGTSILEGTRGVFTKPVSFAPNKNTEVLAQHNGAPLCVLLRYPNPVVLVGSSTIEPGTTLNDWLLELTGTESSSQRGYARSTDVARIRWSGVECIPEAYQLVEGEPLGEPLVVAATRAARALPAVVHDELAGFTVAPHRSGALLVQGVPIGAIPATPATPSSSVLKDGLSEFVLLTAAARLGHPVGYSPEHGGDLVQNIVPTATSSYRQVSTSSKVRLEFHTEAAFHPHRPRYLLLLCLRGDPQAATTLSSVFDVMAVLDGETLRTLQQPRFATGVDESYLHRRSERLGPAVPVISGGPDRPSICFDGDLMVGLDADATAALDRLRAAVDEVQLKVFLEAGDLLVVDNQVAVHGRSPFTPRFDGTDRWLQRTFVVSDLASSAQDRIGRIIDTRFVG
jgi:alpha-ketoglutarate-dependent taurine dioxygenase